MTTTCPSSFADQPAWHRPGYRHADHRQQPRRLDVDIILDEGPDTINQQADAYDTMTAMARGGQPIPPSVLMELSPLRVRSRSASWTRSSPSNSACSSPSSRDQRSKPLSALNSKAKPLTTPRRRQTPNYRVPDRRNPGQGQFRTGRCTGFGNQRLEATASTAGTTVLIETARFGGFFHIRPPGPTGERMAKRKSQEPPSSRAIAVAG